MHVGGTNGKGSTTAFLSSMLREAGHRVAVYTSPHLVSVLERFLVDGRPMSEEAFTAWVRRLEPLAAETKASFFEITTAIAFADFAARGAEIAVIEVGLGGRLDSTNVIEPLAAGVTRIALEHTEYLGPTLEHIAREKAGIAKPGVPFLTTEQDPAVLAVMQAAVGSRQSAVVIVDPESAAGNELGLRGPHQAANASLALALARALPPPWRPDADAERRGLASARLPGRFDRRGRHVFDVAHNPDGMRALVESLKEARLPRPLTAVVAVLRDKDWRRMLTILAPHVDSLILTRAPSAPPDRSWDLAEAEAWAHESGMKVGAVAELGAAVSRGMAATVLITGSFHTVGDAIRLLGLEP